MEKKLEETLLVGISFSDEDKGVLIVGKKLPGRGFDVLNAFWGEEARRIYDILTKKKKEVESNG